MRSKSKNELYNEIAFVQAKLDIAIREFNKLAESKKEAIEQARAEGRAQGLQEAIGYLKNLKTMELGGYGDNAYEMVDDVVKDIEELREAASAIEGNKDA